jgi:hypothetical protein
MAASRRWANERPAHARSRRTSSSPLKTGTGLSGTRGGFSMDIGSGTSSSAASHLKTAAARNWLQA